MEIYVPSLSRFERSTTLERLEGNWDKDKTYLVVREDQFKDYKPLAKKHKVTLLPCPVKGIANTRLFCGRHAKDTFIMFDDDLRFNVRYRDSVRLYVSTDEEVVKMLNMCAKKLKTYAHVAVSARFGNNSLQWPYVENSRPLRALGYQKKPFLSCEHGRVTVMEDFDVTLQLMKKGYKNCIITCYAQGQEKTQAKGGCSDYRTHQVQEESAKLLQKFHPECVNLIQTNKTSMGEFGQRTDVKIYWQRAYKLSTLQKRSLYD